MALREKHIWVDLYDEKAVKVGEAWKIVNFEIHPSNETTDCGFEVMVDNEAVFEAWESSKYGYFIQRGKSDIRPVNLYKYLLDKGIFRPIPVAEGQRVKMAGTSAVGSKALVEIEIYDAGDIKTTDPNGTQASEYDGIAYFRYTGNTLQAGDNSYYPVNLYTKFFEYEAPFIKVPVNREITIWGIIASDLFKISGTGANKQGTMWLKIIKERKILYTLFEQGIPLYGFTSETSDGNYYQSGVTPLGLYSSKYPKNIYLFEQPLILTEGEKFEMVVETALYAGSPNIAYSDLYVYAIVSSKKLR